VSINRYSLEAARYAAALVNADPSPEGYQAVVDRFVQPRCPVHLDEVAPMLDWASRLRALFTERRIDQRIASAEMLALGADRPFVSTHDQLAPHLHYAPVEAGLVVRMRARTAIGLAHLLAEGGGGRLGSCARAGCQVVFVDTSHNGRRRFCSVRCANQVRVSRHRARHR
jgi:predicted RNA-binding Zn ribbon-like protein